MSPNAETSNGRIRFPASSGHSRSASAISASPELATNSGSIRLPDVADREALGEGVVGVDDVRGEAGDPGRAGDRGHDGGTVADHRLLHEPTGEDRAQDALVAEVLVQAQLAAGMEDGHLGAGAGAAGRSVDGAGPGRR